MKYYIKALLIAFAVEIFITLIIIPIIRGLKVGQNERDDGPRSHLKKQGTPTMGGIGFIITTIIMGGVLFYSYKNELDIAKKIFTLLIPTVCFGLIGFIDDFKKVVLHNTKGLSPAKKMLGLLLVSAAFTIFITKYLNIGTEIYVPFVKNYISLNIWVYIPFSILVMLATSNAVNLTDGIDGLAPSVSTIIITCLTIIGIIFGVKEVALFGTVMIGICLAFLLFNLHPAKIFMGDTGSLLLGGAISIIAIYLKMPLLLLIIALIPVLEALSVIIQVLHFKRTGNRVLKMAPLHHHFELSGWSENNVVSIFSIITLIMCVIGVVAI